MSEVVLVTGAATPGVALAARRIAETSDVRVVVVDTTLPADDLGSVKFVRADIRTPVISKVLAVEDVDTVVHMDLAPIRSRGTGSATKEINVIGTMQVLAACQRSERVKRVVLASSAAPMNDDFSFMSLSLGCGGGRLTGVTWLRATR